MLGYKKNVFFIYIIVVSKIYMKKSYTLKQCTNRLPLWQTMTRKT